MNRFAGICRIAFSFVLMACSLLSVTSTIQAQTTDSAPTRFVPFHQVQMSDTIWQPRIRLLVNETLPHAFKNTEVAQRRLLQCAQWLESGGKTQKPEPHRFNTSDLYKVMEGAALMIQSQPNEDIEAMMDRIIHIIRRAQAEDGYLYVPHITGSIHENEMGPRPYSYVLHSHELYNVGHLYEAAVAYAQATGKTELLDVAKKNATHVQKVFFEGDPNYNDGKPVLQAPGHQEIEIGLLKLYQYTGDQQYLKMAKRFLDIRGVTFQPAGQGVNSPTYAQQHLPVAQQSTATGHAVRATYQYAAMAEVDSLMGSDDYSKALGDIWHDIVDRKMHITGGLGAVHGIEGFGPDYVLPNKDTYLETCAAVGNVFFNMRMFLKYRDARYVDVAEVALLNNCLAGMGQDGRSFFYPNPLEADYGHQPRSGWFGTACCPSNLARLIPQVSGYMYATDQDRLFCTLYGSSQTDVELQQTTVHIQQTTQYPWSGKIQWKVDPQKPVDYAMHVRIPSWAGHQFVPGKLYRFQDGNAPQWQVTVNGEQLDCPMEKGFAVIHRQWKSGDQLELNLPMPIRATQCDAKVEDNRDRICITRGPLVFCAEGIDNDGAVQRFFLSADAISKAVYQPVERLAETQPTSAGQWSRIQIPAHAVQQEDEPVDATLTMIPYFAWSNRDRSSMQVWFPTKEALAQPDRMSPANMKFQTVTASHTFEQDTVDAIRMRNSPSKSFDTSIPRWTSWPQTGKPQWVEIQLKEATRIRSIGVYFYDDHGGVQVPAKWEIQIPDQQQWKTMTIYNTDQYSVLPDSYNTVHPAKDLTTDRFRIQMTPQHDRTTVGILSVEVESSDR